MNEVRRLRQKGKAPVEIFLKRKGPNIPNRPISSVFPFMTTKYDNLQATCRQPAPRLLYGRPWKRFFAGYREQMTELTSMEPGTNIKLTEDDLRDRIDALVDEAYPQFAEGEPEVGIV